MCASVFLRFLCRAGLLGVLFLAVGCSPSPSARTAKTQSLALQTKDPDARQAPRYRCQVVNTYPHDVQCYTQGLFYLNGMLYESGGLYGESTLRKVDLESGTKLKYVQLHPGLFAEGITMYNQKILLLSWREHVAMVFDLQTFRDIKQFSYPTEGWGIVFDGKEFIMSDGSSTLYRRDTATFGETGRIYVTDGGLPVTHLNELEWINGEIWANVYQTDRIVKIDPETGHVTGVIQCGGLLLPSDYTDETDVLNGIAYDENSGRIFITGKKWPKVFEIKIAKEE